MSAFVCSNKHIATLAASAVTMNWFFSTPIYDHDIHQFIKIAKRVPDKDDLTPATAISFDRVTDKLPVSNRDLAKLIAQILHEENVRSVNRRYPNHPESTRLINIDDYEKVSPIQTIKLCHCLEYQSCETDDYEDSVAYLIIRALIDAMVCEIPGYEDADWSI